MPSRPPICMSFISRAAPGHRRWSCGRGWKSSEISPRLRRASKMARGLVHAVPLCRRPETAMRWVTIPLLGALAAALAHPAARAQHHGVVEATPEGPYTPRLGDVMIMQQIRHSKLWFAAAANNWELAEHELDSLKTGFADITKLFPIVYEVPVAPAIRALDDNEIVQLSEAIGTRDRFKFAGAFD